MGRWKGGMGVSNRRKSLQDTLLQHAFARWRLEDAMREKTRGCREKDRTYRDPHICSQRQICRVSTNAEASNSHQVDSLFQDLLWKLCLRPNADHVYSRNNLKEEEDRGEQDEDTAEQKEASFRTGVVRRRTDQEVAAAAAEGMDEKRGKEEED